MKREVDCSYARDWIPLGKSRTNCPRCGAALNTSTHPTRDADA
jgi:hypothetical protein